VSWMDEIVGLKLHVPARSLKFDTAQSRGKSWRAEISGIAQDWKAEVVTWLAAPPALFFLDIVWHAIQESQGFACILVVHLASMLGESCCRTMVIPPLLQCRLDALPTSRPRPRCKSRAGLVRFDAAGKPRAPPSRGVVHDGCGLWLS